MEVWQRCASLRWSKHLAASTRQCQAVSLAALCRGAPVSLLSLQFACWHHLAWCLQTPDFLGLTSTNAPQRHNQWCFSWSHLASEWLWQMLREESPQVDSDVVCCCSWQFLLGWRLHKAEVLGFHGGCLVFRKVGSRSHCRGTFQSFPSVVDVCVFSILPCLLPYW